MQSHKAHPHNQPGITTFASSMSKQPQIFILSDVYQATEAMASDLRIHSRYRCSSSQYRRRYRRAFAYYLDRDVCDELSALQGKRYLVQIITCDSISKIAKQTAKSPAVENRPDRDSSGQAPWRVDKKIEGSGV